MDNKERFIEIFTSQIHRPGAAELLEWLESTDFFEAPASTHYHGSYTGGLVEHILDDVAYQDAPTTLQVGGVSKPSDTDFSELERETIWKNTSIKRIGESIAGRYGLGFTYDADDYDIECDEQDGTDSSYYNTLCKNYGLILKVYAKRLWVYDRERYKGKRAVQDFDRTNIIPGSLSYNTTLSGTYTGGYFTYTDADKDLDIVCSVGGGTHTKNVNRRATSVYDASVQLCAEINNANHGRVKLKFSVMGNWGVSAGNNLRLTGYGDGLNGGINGKYFVDKVTHKYTKSGGFVTSFECSGIFDPFHYWDVGGHTFLLPLAASAALWAGLRPPKTATENGSGNRRTSRRQRPRWRRCRPAICPAHNA